MKFKVGERVAVYGSSQTGALQFDLANPRLVGIVIAVSDTYVNVRFKPNDRTYTYHPKQLRRLK